MRYLVAVTSLAAVLAIAPAALGDPGKDYNGPSCTNIVSGDGKYSTFGGTEAILRWDIQTESPTCKNATYTLVIVAVIFVPTLAFRINFEERALVEKFGDAYQDYRRNTPAVFPYKRPGRK